MFQPIGLPASRVLERIAAARNRDVARGKRAGDATIASGGTRMDAACAEVGARCDSGAAINDRKLRVLNAIRLGAGHPANFARYGGRITLIRARIEQWQQANDFARRAFLFNVHSRPDVALNIAVNLVEGWYREERKAFAVAAALGYGNRHSLEVLRELRLMLRLLRRSEYRNHLGGIIGFALGSELEAAE